MGLDVHRAARIMAAAHGGQILISEATRSIVEQSLTSGIEIRDLGEHRLRDLSTPEWLSQAVADDLQADFPPLRTVSSFPPTCPRRHRHWWEGRRSSRPSGRYLDSRTSASSP